jgi:hypothetical protein
MPTFDREDRMMTIAAMPGLPMARHHGLEYH